MTMMQRSSSSSSSSSSLLSLSPTGWNPSRSTISPPSITASPTSEMNLSARPTSPEMRRAFLSPEPARFQLLSSPQHAYAFPSWPIRDSLTPTGSEPSPTTCYFSPNYIPNSRISDTDLEALDFTKRVVVCETEEAVTGISWSAINNPTCDVVPALQVSERRRRLPPPPAQYRRRNSSRKSPIRKNQKSLVAIAE
ncbi:MAG: hypothetical protein GOMPHAMPRED_000306 [Gomphillus americanus]|uniref:Uncharacterized protein n=1 Tax=Gomphillus americanus TaxID=1940652 RepID=A0A8H3I1D7_9LECA|nr:MAG: hypothetical protein GOMPHAMPRED_000306 [Gomphillus americanus]